VVVTIHDPAIGRRLRKRCRWVSKCAVGGERRSGHVRSGCTRVSDVFLDLASGQIAPVRSHARVPSIPERDHPTPQIGPTGLPEVCGHGTLDLYRLRSGVHISIRTLVINRAGRGRGECCGPNARCIDLRRGVSIVGSEREFVRSAILRGLPDFLKRDVFRVGDRHPLGLQQQIV
jgi:hypothetical protein